MEPRGNEQRESGVYYAPDDLASIPRRLSALSLDLLVVFLPWGFLYAIGTNLGVAGWLIHLVCGTGAWWYLAGVKTGGGATIGYGLTKLQLVDLRGRPVHLGRSTCRFLFLFVGPINIVVDLAWMWNDPNRQTWRDKLSATYVVRRGAQPAGEGPITYANYFIGTMSFIVPEVARPADGAKPS